MTKNHVLVGADLETEFPQLIYYTEPVPCQLDT